MGSKLELEDRFGWFHLELLVVVVVDVEISPTGQPKEGKSLKRWSVLFQLSKLLADDFNGSFAAKAALPEIIQLDLGDWTQR